MEEKGETVSGPMLVAKWERFEGLMEVPEDERMKSDGWVPNFCKMYVVVNCSVVHKPYLE